MSSSAPAAGTARDRTVAGVLVAAAIFGVTLLWAKWWPYAGRIGELGSGHTWPGTDILAVGGVRPGDAPSVHAATSFAAAYFLAIWKALAAALFIAAALQTLVPRGALLRLLGRRGGLAGAVVGGLASTPSMMCTCCAAPVAATLRRAGVPTAVAVAYWLGSPLLNPAVLAFLFFVAPWQWTVTRAVVGLVVVVGGAALVAALGGDRQTVPVATVTPDPGPAGTGPVPVRYARALGRLAVTVLPEYVVVVGLLGAFRGWLLPLDAVSGGVLVVLAAAVLGTLLVIPTAGEIPILSGLALAGLSLGAVGALLITLPAVSLPGMALVGKAFGWRVTAATAGVVAAGGVLGGALLLAL
jgi:uncharacterized membrane protein YraQ (UPF0718 family)